MLLSQTLRLFLDAIGRRDEYEYYLGKFLADPHACFAALVPDLDSLEQAGELIAFDLQFLLRLELTPLVVLPEHNAGRMLEVLKALPDLDLYILEPEHAAVMGPQVRAAVEAARRDRKLLTLVLPDFALKDLAGVLLPDLVRRIHLVRLQGGLTDRSGQPVYHLHLQTPPPAGLPDEEQPLLDTAAACLQAMPSMHFSVSSPINLLRELFTVRGAGTIIRRGSLIRHTQSVEDVDLGRLEELLERAFDKPFANPDLFRAVSDFYLEEDYRGAVLLEPYHAAPYLSKFAVGTAARGEGLAQELWSRVTAERPALFWRSRTGNPVNGWYDRQADGRHRSGDWTVFWRGIETRHVPDIVDYAIHRPSDFTE